MKPTIFFSHSSKDRDSILPIQRHLLAKTGNAVDIFMSSDGASIPFGRNWLKEIEEALKNCKLMFVWMTPNSLGSSWIPFEAGYAYSKGIRVVPVGFQGIKLEAVTGPLSILQGFNVAGSAALNNIVEIINKRFHLTFPDLFDDSFYRANVDDSASEDSAELLRFVESVEWWQLLSNEIGDERIVAKSDLLITLKDALSELGISHHFSEHELRGPGFRAGGGGNSDLTVKLDPLALNSIRIALALTAERAFLGKLANVRLTVLLVPTAVFPNEPSATGVRLLKTEVTSDTADPYFTYRFRNIVFEVVRSRPREQQRLRVMVPIENRDPIPLLSLLRLLEERRILSV